MHRRRELQVDGARNWEDPVHKLKAKKSAEELSRRPLPSETFGNRKKSQVPDT